MDFEETGLLLIIYSAFIKCLRKDENKMKQCNSSLWKSTKLMIQLGGR